MKAFVLSILATGNDVKGLYVAWEFEKRRFNF